jgi:hypothetical protein
MGRGWGPLALIRSTISLHVTKRKKSKVLLAFFAQTMSALQESLIHMSRNVFSHLKHRHLFLASKDSFEGIVSIDQRFFLCVLKFVFLDVIPYLFERVSLKLRLVCGRFWLLA